MRPMKSKKEQTKSKKSKQKKGVSPEIALLKTQLARALADYDNLTKRVEREREGLGKIAKTHMLSSLLPAFDMLLAAQNHIQEAGLAMSIQAFYQAFADAGFMPVEAEIGGQFDETYHEAIELINDPEKETGEIIEVVLSGWKHKDGSLIRAAKVKVIGNN